jgi:hypothetical protein
MLPVDEGQTAAAAKIAADGAFTTAVVVAGAEAHPATVAVTEYVPDAATVGVAIVGF